MAVRTTGGRETALVRTILKNLSKVPGLAARKRHGSTMTTAGDPDITGCYEGRHFELEVKRPGNLATPLQLERLEEWRRAGALVGIIHNTREALACLGIDET